MSKDKQQAAIEFCVKLGKTATETRELLQQAYDDLLLGEAKFSNGISGLETAGMKNKLSILKDDPIPLINDWRCLDPNSGRPPNDSSEDCGNA